MKTVTDGIVIGAGLSGAAVARTLAEHGLKVHILEKRGHIGGNMYDYVDKSGIIVQEYGPHTFHTKNARLYEYITQFADWHTFKLTCGAVLNGKYTPTPFNFTTVDTFFPPEKAERIKATLLAEYPNRSTVPVLELLGSDNEDAREYAEFLFDNDYRPYSAKQWGIPPEKIDKSVLARVPIRLSYDVGYFDDAYQCVPTGTFTEFIENMLSHPNIGVEAGVDALTRLQLKCRKTYFDGKVFSGPIVYTGALDRLFASKYGALPYRSIRFDFRSENVDSFQEAPVVAYPQAEGYTRVTEFKKLYPQTLDRNCGKTIIAYEYSAQYNGSDNSEPYYPIINDENRNKYEKYLSLAQQFKNLYVCGRLGDFKYYNMDQALERALALAENILHGEVK